MNDRENPGEPDPIPEIDLPMEHQGPVQTLDRIEASLLFAQISRISYMQPHAVNHYIPRLGMRLEHFADRNGAQAYIFGNDSDIIVACRGTEPNDWNDVKADVNAFTVLAETVGRVHRGFKQEVDDLWPALEAEIAADERTLWFTGHSLGGAMATISAGRCFLAHIPATPQGVFTYGAPRVGTSRYINNVDVDLTRWVNNNDIVPRVPPTWMGYRHTGRRMYINTYGKVRRMTKRQRVKDRWRGFFHGLRQGKVDHFSDHAIARYIEHIATAVAERSSGRP
ncbi:MAG: lipase family protein [Acidimicrobiia bacterium]|nr:lipase family protein [Acidimicrobiia bacterium]